MRPRVIALALLVAASTFGVVVACSSPSRPPSINPWVTTEAGSPLDDVVVPPYVPRGSACVRDDAVAPAAFLVSPDAGNDDAAIGRSPQVLSAGGPVLSLPTLVAVTFPEDELRGAEDDFIDSIGCTDYWRTVSSDYGVGEAVATPPVHLVESAPSVVDDAQIQIWLADKIEGDATFPRPDKNTLYVLFYPSGTRVTFDGASSCYAFGGYHYSVEVAGMQVPYAVIPRCDNLNGLKALDEVTAVTSHELIEAASDPMPGTTPAYSFPDNTGWGFAIGAGTEVGDMCELKTDAFFQPAGYPFHVQRTWSNRSAFGFDDPCQPAMAGPFFAAAPSLTGTITVTVGNNLPPQSIPGVTLALGQRVSVDVVAFARGPVPPWHLDAYDGVQLRGGPPDLSLSLDKTTVQDGDVVHLQIQRQASTFGVSPFAIVSSGAAGRQAYFWGVAN